MYKATIVSDGDDWLHDLQQVHALVGDRVEDYARREVRPFVSQQIDQTLRREPPQRRYPNDYPLEWASAKQRKYVMAKLRAEGNIPYRRTHKQIRSWHVRADYKNGLSSIVVYSDSDVEEFVTGKRRQRYHRITGWRSSADVLQVIVIEVEQFVQAGLSRIVREVFNEL